MDKVYEVLGTPLTDIEIGATGIRSILQGVKTIISTWRGTVFLDRLFGINTRMIDSPINVLHASLSVDITQQLAKYEPRVEVVSISFENSDAAIGVERTFRTAVINAFPTGSVIPVVRIRIKDGVLL